MDVFSQDSSSVAEILRQAVEHHQSGQLNTARLLYTRYLSFDPRNSKGWYLLGCVCHQLEDVQTAERFLRKAIAIDPNCEHYHHNLATILQTQHRTEDAITAFHQALNVNPEYSKAMHGLGTAYQQDGNLDEALRCFNQVLVENPDHFRAKFNKGILHFQQGDSIEAIAVLQEVLLENPETPGIHLYLGKAYHTISSYKDAIQHFQVHLYLDQGSIQAMQGLGEAYLHLGRISEAMSCFQKLLARHEDSPEAHNNLAICYQHKREPLLAQESYKQAILLAPDNPVYRNNLGTLLLKSCRIQEAISLFQEALGLKPHYPDALVNLGNAHMEAKNLELAERCFNEVLQVNSKQNYALWHRSLLSLLRGNLLDGFADYEVRQDCAFLSLEKRSFTAPRWRGEENQNSSLLVYCEQGFGDSIQFARFVTEIQEKVGQLYLECPSALKRVFNSILPAERVILRGADSPQIDYTCPLHSLPHILGTTLESIPAVVPYLHAPSPPLPEMVADVLSELDTQNQIIGIAWAGNPEQTNDRRRSSPLSTFLPLQDIEGIKLLSLQVQLRDGDEELLKEYDIPSLGAMVQDFGDTAQILSSLDLFIGVDTSVSHLSGAMGMDTWILLSYAADWRWMEDRDDSPWYPTVKLFRQPRPGDWDSVLKQVAKELKKWLRKKGRTYTDSFSDDEITASASQKTLDILKQFVEES